MIMPKERKKNEPLRATAVEDGYSKGSLLSYAWGKVREHDAFILFDLVSMHNFILTKLATKLSIHDFEIGEATQADRAFKGQEVLVTPLIGKLRLHIHGQGRFLYLPS